MTTPRTTAPVACATQADERRARRFWVSFIVGLLSLQVAGGAAAIYLAVSDPTVAVIPNYYQSSLNWDVKRRQSDLYRWLGWNCAIRVEPEVAGAGQRIVTLQLRDRHEQPVADVVVSARVYHHARGNEIHPLRFDQGSPGDYLAITQLVRGGLWQLDVTIEGDHGIAETSIELMVTNGTHDGQ